MFDPGTKVVVIASTQKSGAGPRKGSMGHIITSGSGVEIEHNLIANSHVVSFYRFGFEQKVRFESRTVLNLLQFINNSTEDSVAKQTHAFQNFFNSPKIDDVIQKVGNYMQILTGTPIVIMVPYGEVDDDLLTCKDIEFEIWAKAIFLIISRILHSMYIDTPIFTRNPQLWKSKLRSLYLIVNNKAQKDEHIKFMLSDPIARENFIQTVDYLLVIQNKAMHTARRDNFADFINQGIYNTYSNNKFTPETVRAIYKLLYDNLYNLSFDSLIQHLVDKPGRACVKNVMLMKKEFKSISEGLLSENTSN